MKFFLATTKLSWRICANYDAWFSPLQFTAYLTLKSSGYSGISSNHVQLICDIKVKAVLFEEDKLKRVNNYLVVFGLVYSVLWTVIVYYIWDDSPEIFTILDVITDIVLLHLAYDIYKKKSCELRHDGLLKLAQLFSLAYATIWTVVIMTSLEIDIEEILLPLDLISLYATISLSMTIWKTLRQSRRKVKSRIT